MTQPKQPTEPATGKGSQAENPTGATPHGVPDGAAEHEPTGGPTSDRVQSETAVSRTKKS